MRNPEMNELSDRGFLDHLEELRSELLKIGVCFLLLCIPAWYFSEQILSTLLDYAAPKGFALHYFTLMEPFLTRMKITLMLSLAGSLPWTLFRVWHFIAPALLEEEKKALFLPLCSVFLLALLGAAISLFFVVPSLIGFSLSFAGENLRPVIGIGDFISMILIVLLAGMGLFQFPMVLYVLLVLGVVNLETVRKKRPYIVVLIFILSAVFSPPDVVSQLLLAFPACLLLELSLLIFSFRKEKKDCSYEEIYEDHQ